MKLFHTWRNFRVLNIYHAYIKVWNFSTWPTFLHKHEVCSSTASEFCHPSTYSLCCNIHQGRHLYVEHIMFTLPSLKCNKDSLANHNIQTKSHVHGWRFSKILIEQEHLVVCVQTSSSNLLCGWEAGGRRKSCSIFFWKIFDLGKNCHHHSPTVAAAFALNKVFKRPLLIYNRFVQGLIYGFWRRPVCKIIRDYQMDFEKCNKIINYLDYPNGGRIWSVYCLANSWQHDIAWHMLPILAQAKAH